MYEIEKYGWVRKDTEEYTLFYKDDDFEIICFSFIRLNKKNGKIKIALNSEISLEELVEIYRTAKILKEVNSHEPMQV